MTHHHIGPGGQRPAFQGSTAGRDEAPLPAPTPAGGLGAGTQPDPRGALLLLGGAGPSSTAVHEAGHAVVGYLHGFPLVAVSIRRAAAHAGITLADLEEWQGPRLVAGLLPHDQPPVAVARMSRLVLWLLAGNEAERIAGPPAADGWAPVPLLPADVAALPPRAQELLTEAEARPADDPEYGESDRDDEKLARDRAVALAGDDPEIGMAVLHVLRLSAQRLLLDHWPAVLALARALDERRVLSGAACIAVIQSAGTVPAQVKE